MDFDQLFIWRLLIAVPEFEFDEEIIALLEKFGIIRWDAMYFGDKIKDYIERDKSLGRRMRDATLIQRILMVMPEVLSVETVDWLSTHGLISKEIAHRLRIALRAKDALAPVFVAESALSARMGVLMGAIFSHETIDIIREIDEARINRMTAALRSIETDKEKWLQEFIAKETERLKPFNFDMKLSRKDHEYLDRVRSMTREEIIAQREMNTRVIKRARELSIARAAMARQIVTSAKTVFSTIIGIHRLSAEVRAADNAWDSVTVVLSRVLSDDVLRAAIRAGIISKERYDAIRSLEALGLDIWTKVGKTFKYESFAARALLMSEGIISHEMLEALYQNKLIDKLTYTYMQPAVNIIRRTTRAYGVRFRRSQRIAVMPGENPLASYLRHTEATDRALLKLLAEAAEDARKTAMKLEAVGTIGARARAAQQRLVENELLQAIRRTYEQVGYVIIHGEKQAAVAAADAMDLLTGKLWGDTKKMQDLKREITRSSRSGIEAYVSRQENIVQLSRRIYNGGVHGQGAIKREIDKALLRDLSAREFAKKMEQFFKPNAPGGISYSAMRLARTEINNAFHYTQIRYTREMPWVQGYKWNRSGRANSRPHACSEYANNDSYNMGKGVFPKSEVPGKPHPLCLCFITAVTMSNGDFEKRLRTGAFDNYFKSVRDGGYFESAWDVDRRNVWLEYLPTLGETAKYVAAGQFAAVVRNAFLME